MEFKEEHLKEGNILIVQESEPLYSRPFKTRIIEVTKNSILYSNEDMPGKPILRHTIGKFLNCFRLIEWIEGKPK